MLFQAWSLLVAIIFVASILGDHILERIYHGKPASKNEFPYVVRIYIKINSYEPLCTGTMVASRLVLTAAHCCVQLGRKIVVSGDEDQERFYKEVKKTGNTSVTGYRVYNVSQELIHPKFKEKSYTILHDVCLLRLEKPANATEYEHAVIAASYGRLYARKCTSVGFGEIADSTQFKLHHKKVFAEVAWRGNWIIRLYFHSICSGDSGGPLLCGNKIYGVASFSTAQKCEEFGHDYYAYLHEERNFLEQFLSGSVGVISDWIFTYLAVILLITL